MFTFWIKQRRGESWKLILVVFSFLDYLICFISVAEMRCLKGQAVCGSEKSVGILYGFTK